MSLFKDKKVLVTGGAFRLEGVSQFTFRKTPEVKVVSLDEPIDFFKKCRIRKVGFDNL